MHDQLLESALRYATGYLKRLPERPVGDSVPREELRAAMRVPLSDDGEEADRVLAELAEAADRGLLNSASPRFFGFVIGGTHPIGLAADWLTSTWDQNSGLFLAAPAAIVSEEVASEWILDLLKLPATASTGFVTGAQMAHFVALAAARDHVLRAAGWDVEAYGLQGAPRVRVVAGDQAHSTIPRALKYLGLGTETVERIPSDDQGRMDAEVLRELLAGASGPTIVCAQAGDVNSGAFDPLGDVCDIAHERGAWVHVDGAFGLWAATSPRFAHLVAGAERADSWTTDAHKWLNVPYDSGIVACAHPDAHRAAMTVRASYLVHGDESQREPMDWTPEFSRRARGFTIYATLRYLGRKGVEALVERCCDHARLFADLLAAEPGVEVLNDVVLNQALVRFVADDGDHDRRTQAVIRGVQEDGTCWLGGSVWKGMHVMRISVSNWATTREDVERSAEAVLRVARSVQG